MQECTEPESNLCAWLGPQPIWCEVNPVSYSGAQIWTPGMDTPWAMARATSRARMLTLALAESSYSHAPVLQIGPSSWDTLCLRRLGTVA